MALEPLFYIFMKLLRKSVSAAIGLFSIVGMNSCTEYEMISQEVVEVVDNSIYLDRNKVLDAVNALRTSGCDCGGEAMPPVVPLEWSAHLANASQKHSEDMYKHQFFNHKGSDNSTVDIRVDNTGFAWRLLGENIARGNFDEVSAVEAWRLSKGHCLQMMHADYTQVGVGRMGNYWTMVLAK